MMQLLWTAQEEGGCAQRVWRVVAALLESQYTRQDTTQTFYVRIIHKLLQALIIWCSVFYVCWPLNGSKYIECN